MENKFIHVNGAKVHNLKNISVKIPKNKITVISGVSGSGKSSLAFDTIFAEGQRRYIESLSSYARQFLGQIEKPNVASIFGIVPAISIDQKTKSHNPRSTVGTVTEVWDYLRLLYSKLGSPLCINCHGLLTSVTIDDIYNEILNKYENKVLSISAPLVTGRKGTHEKIIADIIKKGFTKIRINSILYQLDTLPKMNKNRSYDLELVIDRTLINVESKTRIFDSLEQAFKFGDGFIKINANDIEIKYSLMLACHKCMLSREKIEPRSFSFNSPFGACPQCEGLGSNLEVDINAIMGDENLSVLQGAIIPWSDKKFYPMFIKVFKTYNIDINTPFKNLPKKFIKVLYYGDENIEFEIKFEFKNIKRSYLSKFEGIVNYLDKKLGAEDNFDERFIDYFYRATCSICGGSRLNIEARSVLIDKKTIIELSSKTIEELSNFFSKLEYKNNNKDISEPITREILLRLEFLKKVGLGYLTLQRSANTLSGGESQRIRLASQIGSGLSGVLYVLDEPSIGLHPSDNLKLLETLTNLKNIGNTLIIVEHDFETIMSSDYVIDIGEKAGKHGGEVIYQGKPSSLLLSKQSLTGKYLSNRLTIKTPSKRRVSTDFIKIKGASENNLKNIDFAIPKGVITAITGISGSGKSTLINDTLANFLLKKLSRKGTKIGKHKAITGYEQLDKIVIVDQSPIGRTPRSNPATYTGLFLLIRDIFAATSEAKIRGYNSGRFSFNVKSGRCQSCSGEGNITVVMNFLPDVHVICELCKGKRYNNETLEVKYKNKSIADILELTVTEAALLFKDNPTIYRYLKTLQEVGLGYISLGQPATTLSGGEAQRVKLASELHKKNIGKTIYIFDEPTTGLHFYDIDLLINIFHKLADYGNTLVVIEHNLDVIRNSDYIIDLGPGGGPNGGSVIATGTPEEIADNVNSITGIYLKKELERLS